MIIVYIEANFALEIALDQPQAEDAKQLLVLARDHVIEIAIPASALHEPFSTMGYRRVELKSALNAMQVMAQQQKPPLSSHLKAAIEQVSNSNDYAQQSRNQMDRLESITLELLENARCIQTDVALFKTSLNYSGLYKFTGGLDAIAYSAIISDLDQLSRAGRNQTRKCFVSRDKQAFEDPGISGELRTYNCVYKSTFPAALAYIRSQLGVG
jgi:hypothetical protein